MSLKKGKAAQPAKEAVSPAQRSPAAKASAEGSSVWGTAPRTGSGPARPQPSSSSSSVPAKAKAQAKTSLNIAALAARNLGVCVPNKIFVGGVPITVSDEQFRSYFESFGAISRVELHALRGFGYVTYESVEAVDACLEKYDEHYFNKKWVEVKRSIPRELIESYEREQKRLLAEQEGESGATTSSPGLPAPGGASWSGPTTGLPPPPAKAGSWPGGPPTGPGHHQIPPGGWAARGPAPGVRRKPEPSGTVVVSKVAQLKEMGFSEAVAKQVLAECVWDVNAAIDRLLSSGVMPGEESTPPEPSSSEAFPSLGGGSSAPAPASGYHPRTEDFHVEEPGESEAYAAGSPGAPAAGFFGEPDRNAVALEEEADAGHEEHAEAEAAAEVEPMEEPTVEDEHSQAQAPQPPQSPQPTPPPQSQQSPQASPTPQTPQQQQQEAPVVSSPKREEQPPPAAPASPTQNTAGDVGAALAQAATPGARSGAAPGPTPAPAGGTGAGGADPVPPRKRLERAAQQWTQQDHAQLGVTEGQFVNTWLDTRTEHGWIHAEAFVSGNTGATTAGWLPVCVLQELPEGRRWMRALQRWVPMDETQCGVEEGASVIVWVGSRTKEGWAYVEAEEGAGGPSRPGWLPVFCLEWIEE